MRKFFIISLILLSSLTAARAIAEDQPVQLQDNPPDRYIVVKGDTLWGISQRFLKDPWQWPQVWGMNREQIHNPHLIYPGDVVVLDLSGKTPALRLVRDGAAGTGGAAGTALGRLETVKLNPSIRVETLERAPIPAIPASVIEPFLSQPLVIEANVLENSPRIVAAQDQRVVLGAGDRAYVQDMPKDKGADWQIYRVGKTLFDPDTQEILGYEAVYLGQARVIKFDEASPIEITKSTQEISTGDRLVVASSLSGANYVPHAPEKAIKVRVISAYGGITEGAQNTIVTLNKGARDGLERGHVLALYRHTPPVKNSSGKVTLRIPDERYGLLMIFRTFEKVSYALVLQTTRPVNVLDVAQTP